MATDAVATEHQALIQQLRSEAESLKDCFTRFSFQAIAFSALVFGLLSDPDTPQAVLLVASAFVVTMLLAVARIGTYKYGNANLLHGYELHLERTRNLTDTKSGWQRHMRSIGWEEARRAWRVVQVTFFRHLYYHYPVAPNLLRREHRKVEREFRWFEPAVLVSTAGVGAAYHPGGYLRLMLTMLHVLAVIATLPGWFLGIDAWNEEPTRAKLYLVFAFGLVVFVGFRALQDYPRLRLLEHGLLSIHSSAVMWQAAVLAHYRALAEVKKGSGSGYENYTKNLALQAADLRAKAFRIDQWMGY